jgi:hypothetical protein
MSMDAADIDGPGPVGLDFDDRPGVCTLTLLHHITPSAAATASFAFPLMRGVTVGVLLDIIMGIHSYLPSLENPMMQFNLLKFYFVGYPEPGSEAIVSWNGCRDWM